ncbi:uncharacterized protein LOC120352750 [Nilaparvata lugens]|uniref:uncharacterized protein LOC120352750 n=1 Tax=Nilaparvata lugens TaxID=108931 RepID=UPI00193DF34F|nr:uncharacterized protein LOC120352750 [Nilaparvata lugens]
MPSFTYCLNFFYSTANADAVLRLIQPTLFYDGETEDSSLSTEFTEDASTLVESEDANNLNLLLSAEFFFNLVITSYTLKPLFRILLFWLRVKSLDAAALPVMCFNPFESHFTCDVTRVSHVLLLSLVQLIYLYDVAMASHATHEALFFCIGNTVTDMKVLQLELGLFSMMHLIKGVSR